MTAKSKYEKDSCWGTGPMVDGLRALARNGITHYACQACGAEATTAGYGRLDTGHITVAYLCRDCHPAHDRDTEQVTELPGISIVQTRCTTTANIINRIVPTADIPEWVGNGIWFMPDDLPAIKDMPQPWVDAASEEHEYLWRAPK